LRFGSWYLHYVLKCSILCSLFALPTTSRTPLCLTTIDFTSFHVHVSSQRHSHPHTSVFMPCSHQFFTPRFGSPVLLAARPCFRDCAHKGSHPMVLHMTYKYVCVEDLSNPRGYARYLGTPGFTRKRIALDGRSLNTTFGARNSHHEALVWCV
jgi:hypothetical protein